MPTRIVLRETAPSQVSPRFRRNPAFLTAANEEEAAIERTAASTVAARNRPEPENNHIGSPTAQSGRTRSSTKRSILGFRSSILRELSVRSGGSEEADVVRVSSEDIRASPRLLGYLFSMIAAAVMLVSVIQFKERSGVVTSELNPRYVATLNGIVYRWKLWGALYVASIGVGMSFAIVLVHFDTIVAPAFWVKTFRDGSLSERNLIFALILYWAASLHICTSSLSVGEVQANVYFTTWIAFGSIALNYGVWRESAGFPSMLDIVNRHRRETTYNWIWTALFSAIFAGSATDIFYNRSEIELRFRGEDLNLVTSDWVVILSIVWSEFAFCLIAIFLNEWFQYTTKCPCVRRRESGNYRFVLGWRQIEGFVILLSAAGKFYVILEYTGVNGVINGLSNAYFGVWGSFFNTIFCFATWLKENRNLAYFVREPTDEEAEAAAEP